MVRATGNLMPNGDILGRSEVPVIAREQPPIQGAPSMDGQAGYVTLTGQLR
jgi:hypothetical protein